MQSLSRQGVSAQKLVFPFSGGFDFLKQNNFYIYLLGLKCG